MSASSLVETVNERTCVPSRRRFGRIATLLALFAATLTAVVGALPGVAHAEITVVNSSPANGDVLATSPTVIVIEFSEELGETNAISLDCETEPITLTRPEILDDGRSLSVEVPEPLPRGTCTTRWSVTNVDGEPDGQGVITFTVENATATTLEPTDSTTQPTPTTVAPTAAPVDDGDGVVVVVDDLSVAGEGDGPLWLGRLLSVLGVAALFGALVVIASAWPEGVEYLITIRFLRAVWILALVGTLLYVAAAAASVTGSGLGSGFSPGSWLDLIDAGWAGRAALARLLLVAACAWVAFRPDRVIDPATQMVALGIPALAVVTIGFSRTVGDLPVLGVLIGSIHALGMAVWVGGVILLARVVLAGPGEEDLVHAVRGFGRLSTLAIVVTITTGIVQMIRLDGGALFTSSHGRVVLLKSLAVAAMVFIALSARQFVTQRMARANEMTVSLSQRLRRAFGVEAAFGIVAIALSAWLLALSPPNIDSGPTIDYAINRSIEVPEVELDVVVRLTDDRVGLVGMEVEVKSPDSGLSDLQVVLAAPPNDLNLGAIIQPVPLDGSGVAVRLEAQGLPLVVAGDWMLQVDATTSAGAVSSTPQVVTILREDGSSETVPITTPPTSLVELTTIPTTDG